jgi:hypothetical protein
MGPARHPDADGGVVARPRQPRRRHRPCRADNTSPTARDRRTPTSERGARCAGDIQHRQPVGSRHQRHAAPGPAQRAAGRGGSDRRRDVLQGCLTAHPAYRPNIRRLKQAGATILEGEHSITVSHHGFSWTAIRDALQSAPARTPRSSPDSPRLTLSALIAAWRDAGRQVVAVSNNSQAAVAAYVDAAGLQLDAIVGPRVPIRRCSSRALSSSPRHRSSSRNRRRGGTTWRLSERR